MDYFFDRGTIVIERGGPPPARRGGLPAFFRWDPRVSLWRAPGHCLEAFRRWLEARPAGRGAYRSGRPPGFEPDPVLEGKLPSLRPYQEEALRAWSAAGRRGLVALPTGSGKTRLAIHAILALGVPTIVIVPTRQLLRQWTEALAQFYPGPIGAYGDGEREVKPVTVATYASAHLQMDRFGDHFDLLVIDEAHHLTSPQVSEVAMMVTAPFRLGLSGTPPQDSADRQLFEELLGGTCFSIPVARLTGCFLATFEVKVLPVHLDRAEQAAYDALRAVFLGSFRPFVEAHPEASWTDWVRDACGSPAGRAAVRALRSSKEILALARSKLLLLDTLLDQHRDDPKLVFTGENRSTYEVSKRFLVPAITCDIQRNERQEILRRFHDGSYRTIVSAKVLNEGLDVPAASVAIVIGGSSSPLEHAQRIGRVLRPVPGKKATVYEIAVPGTSDWRNSERRDRRNALEPPLEV